LKVLCDVKAHLARVGRAPIREARFDELSALQAFEQQRAFNEYPRRFAVAAFSRPPTWCTVSCRPQWNRRAMGSDDTDCGCQRVPTKGVVR
jgi:hypothetical protein